MITKIGLIFSIFMFGAMAAFNLAYIKYEIPYAGSWEKFTLVCLLALICGYTLATKRR